MLCTDLCRRRIEAELANINKNLNHISHMLQSREHGPVTTTAPVQVRPRHVSPPPDEWDLQGRSPFQLLGTTHMMMTLGLEPNLLQNAFASERANPSVEPGRAPTFRIMHHEDAVRALSAFSEYIHTWYPILRPGFSEHYMNTIFRPLTSGPDSCLVLLVAALGFLVEEQHAVGGSSASNHSAFYFEAAMGSLPKVVLDASITSVQCLVLLAIYWCCSAKPCQAYEYVVIASLKVQNLLRTCTTDDTELYEKIKRAYWAILLLESELQDQLDSVRSGIWNLNETTPLPDDRDAWLFETTEAGRSPATSIISPSNKVPGGREKSNKAQAYFLAEIAIRRLLHRCNTATKTNSDGTYAHAPGVAVELQRQLDEWYCYLPEMIRFEDDRVFDFDILTSPSAYPSADPPSSFLRVQYYCYKLNIYWPAVYQCIQDGVTTVETKEFAERFFNAYIQLMPTILTSIWSCIVNRWTLCMTVFMTTMAALKAASTPCLRESCNVDWERLANCLNSARNVDKDLVRSSPSLRIMDRILVQRLDAEYSD